MRKRRGFMLADVVIAAVILAIAFGAVVGTIGYAMKMGLYQRDRAAVYDVLEEFVASMDMTGNSVSSAIVGSFDIKVDGPRSVDANNPGSLDYLLQVRTIYVPAYTNVMGSSSSPVKFLISPDF
ncbi:hypothetical protein FACS1894216_03150 [Synergistales bacterium]|nr:hypothetical protein FACS1894216_03150 [Synergistales bacterium]